MTPIEAFELLRERRLQEITRGRTVRELTDFELLEILRLCGCRIPLFKDADEADAWGDSEECAAMLNEIIDRGSNGKLPLSADGRA